MKLSEAKLRFIETWGALGTNWGINRTMAQIHAYLLVAEKPLSTDDVMEGLNISRGNANMNIRNLMDWQLVHKKLLKGERKDHFEAEKNISRMAIHIIRQRRNKELEPLRSTLAELKNVKENTKAAKAFEKTMKDIDQFAGYADSALDKMVSADEKGWLKMLMKVLG